MTVLIVLVVIGILIFKDSKKPCSKLTTIVTTIVPEATSVLAPRNRKNYKTTWR